MTVKVCVLSCGLIFCHQLPRAKAKSGVAKRVVITRAPGPMPAGIWLVEESAAHRLYSSGLAIDTTFAVHGTPRTFTAYSPRDLRSLAPASKPAGIVFHTTESLIVSLDPAHNTRLKRTREEVLEHVRRDRLYNFVIDRFGQVFSIVPEEETAFHAGHSIWADAERVFIDLNESFIGVSFEAQTDTTFAPTAAQTHAGRLLTEMLRNRYGIAEGNCVTHAQVSVNPSNMRIGYHTDWASNFPFRDLGLLTGYAANVPAVSIFGFDFDDTFLEAIGGHAWAGLTEAGEQLDRDAETRGMAAREYKQFLQQHYKNLRRQRNERAG